MDWQGLCSKNAGSRKPSMLTSISEQRLGSTALTFKVLGPPRAWNLAETALGKTCTWSDSCVLTIWPRTAQRNYVSLYVQMRAIECRCILLYCICSYIVAA